MTDKSSSSATGAKRARLSPEPDAPHPSPAETSPAAHIPPSQAASAFRNVSACNRCRLRKNRCDQRLPACASCEKAGVKCVGYDPITKQEIPRSYVFYLENRVTYLESLLTENALSFDSPQAFDFSSSPASDRLTARSPHRERPAVSNNGVSVSDKGVAVHGSLPRDKARDQREEETDKLNKLVSNIGMVSVQGASDSRYLGSTSGITFARVVFAAVKSSMSTASSERGGVRPSKPLALREDATSEVSMRDSCFGLQAKLTMKQAPFPEKELGRRLIDLYFEHANPQIPILHRGEFMSIFEKVYASEDGRRTPRELYMLNIVYAIGAGIIFGDSDGSRSIATTRSTSPTKREPTSPSSKRQKLSARQCQPEEYHASAIVHLESFLGSMSGLDRSDGFSGGLSELQAVLLLASFALLRPVAPGLWYIVGVAVRLGVDLGLHYEDGTGIDENVEPGLASSQADVVTGATGEYPASVSGGIEAKERGRRQWVRDLRRRLWWCVYSFDRLVSTCVGRPFGITDQAITTEFPSVLDDEHITPAGFTGLPNALHGPSYKRASHHYFRLRLLQSEILQVLQYRQAQHVLGSKRSGHNEYMHTNLASPFLQNFDSFQDWRRDIDRRLWEWKESAPQQQDTAVKFSVYFLELNYWQAVIMLYRQSLSVPAIFAGEVNPSDDVLSPIPVNREEQEDEDDVFMKLAEAGQRVLKLYRQLHRLRLVNYTFLATHHLFMAGIAFLYAIWHSATVRSHLTLDDVDFTVLAATSVLGDLMDKCPPAEACRDAFDRMSKATVQMCLSTTGFGSRTSDFSSPRPSHPKPRRHDSASLPPPPPPPQQQHSPRRPPAQQDYFNARRRTPQFDMNLRDLFTDEPPLPRSQSPHALNPAPHRLRPPRPAPDFFPAHPIDPVLQPAPTPPWAPASTPLGLASGSAATPAPAPAGGLEAPASYDVFGFPHEGEAMGFLLDGLVPVGGGRDGGIGGGDGSGSRSGSRSRSGTGRLDLGFGFDIDVEHDWSDGAQFDLFDGFFFGGAGVGAGAGAVVGSGVGAEAGVGSGVGAEAGVGSGVGAEAGVGSAAGMGAVG